MPLECREEDGQLIYTVCGDSGPLGFVVIDSTVGGRSRGGLRLAEDVVEEEVRLAARSMTLKYGLLGLPQGGAKAGVIGDGESGREERRRRLAEFAQGIEALLVQRAYVPDSDIGTCGEDIRWMLQSIGLLIKRGEWWGDRSGHYTAIGCAASVAAAVYHLGDSLAGCRVAIEGFGSVGSELAVSLRRSGAIVVAVSTSRGAIYNDSGLDVDSLVQLAKEVGSQVVQKYERAERLDRTDLLELPVDILCPCARYHSLHEGNAPRVAARVLCGGANNPITAEAERVLSQRGVLSVPDFLSNCGGVWGGTMEFTGIAHAQIDILLERHIGRYVSTLLADANREGISPWALAERNALARSAEVAAAVAHPTLTGRLFAFGLDCHRRGWIPKRLAATMAPRYFERLLRR